MENINKKSIIRSAETNSTVENFLPVFIVASIVLLLKLFMSYHVYGTNDITYWINFAEIIQKYGTFKIYSLVRIYNHPPLMSWVLKVVSMASVKTGLAFPFVFRMMPIFADYAGIFIIWKLLERYGMRHRVLICSICSINPVNFFISGFHGNTDPVFIFLVLLAIYFTEDQKVGLSGIAYGVSLCVKIVPIILFPAFLFYLRTLKQRITFIVSCMIVPVVVFLPYLFREYHAVVNNIFLYSSLKGIWGFGHICRSIINDPTMSLETRRFFNNAGLLHIEYGQILFLIVIVAALKFFTDKKVLNMTEGAFFVFSTFLTFTPGFGVQYLSWLSIFAVLVLPYLGTLYICVGGIFLFKVYYYWSRGIPPYYANSDIMGQWVGFEKILDLAVWIIVAVMFVVFVYKKTRLSLSVSR